jgi:hypothetical protein
MAILVLKLALTPLLIAVASFVQRRWGAALGGLIVGLPLTSGPVLVFLAVDQGSAFAARSAIGMLLGTVAMSTFCAVYVLTARHWAWPLSSVLALAACTLATFAASLVPQNLALAAAITFPALLALIAFIGRPATRAPEMSPPWWDLPAQMATAAAAVILITAAAQLIGPMWSGLLATLPVFSCVMGVFSHRHAGYSAAHGLLRGIVVGALGAAAFFLVVGSLVRSGPLAVTYASATIAALVVAGLSHRLFDAAA